MAAGEHEPKSALAPNGDQEPSENVTFTGFGILARCETCGWTWDEGKSTNKVRWNTLRHFCQKHGKDEHKGSAFRISSLVDKSWQQAKDDFGNGQTVVLTESDAGMHTPAFLLTRQ